jgi:hypothetical protein
MFAVDIASFGRRDPDLQLHLRAALYQIIQESCDVTGIAWDDCYHEDGGDGLLVITHTDESIEALLDTFVTQVRTGLRKYNKVASITAQIELRMAIHAGYIYRDAHGTSGTAVTHLFRLLEAPVLKTELARRHSDFALIVSDYLYREIIRYAPGLIDPVSFQHVTVEVKETRSPGWIWRPPSGQAGQRQAGQRQPDLDNTASRHVRNVRELRARPDAELA